LDSSSSGTNCIADEDFALIRRSSFTTTPHVADKLSLSDADAGCSFTQQPADVIWDEMSNELLNSDICYEQGIIEIFTEAEESLISYLSGWVARRCSICAECQTVLCKRLTDHSYCRRPIDDFASMKRFIGSASVGLVEPCDELFVAVHVMEEYFRLHYANEVMKTNVAMSLFGIIYPKCNFEFLYVRHPEHACYLSEKVTKTYITMRIYYAVKFANRNLKINMTMTSQSQSSRRHSTKRKMEKVLHM